MKPEDIEKVELMNYMDDFNAIRDSSGRKVVLYGMGERAEALYPYLGKISYVCDQKADSVKDFHEITVIKPEDLANIKEKLLILICVKKEFYRTQIKERLSHIDMDAMVFDIYDNVAFNCFHPQKREIRKKDDLHKVHIVCACEGWILQKFAVKMQEELNKRGIEADIGKCVDFTADINHHIAYHEYEPLRDCHDTLMITHIDSVNKINLLKHQLQVAKMGICMSRETMERLAVYGVPREKLCYINPAQDGVIKPKKYILGITHKTHEDHRKNENVLITLCKELDPDYFAFKIMGSGWGDIVKSIRNMGFHVEYFDDFDYEEYTKLMPSLDYYLFWGFDEGSMGYLDALRAGVRTIVTPQGYHLDVKDGITYPCRTILDIKDVLLKLQEERKRIVDSVENWTWKNYVNKHLEVWNYLLGNEERIYKNQHLYEDGIFSVMRMDA